MEIIYRLMKMNLQQLQKVCNNMDCKHGSQREMINNLIKPLFLNYSMETNSFLKFHTGYLNNLKQQQKYLLNLLKNKENNLKQIISDNKSKWFVDKNKKEIENIQQKILKIQEEIDNISGDKLQKLFLNQQKLLNDKDMKGKAKIMKKIAGKKNKQKAILLDRKKTRAERKDNRDFNRFVKQAHRHYKNVNIPEYLKEKLKKMPGNRGFVYKSVHYFGYLPDKKYESVILTERKPNGTLLTHEYTDTKYILHSKEKDKPQKIIQRKMLKIPVPERKKKKRKKKNFKKKKKNMKTKY
jgi:hypothetical protein